MLKKYYKFYIGEDGIGLEIYDNKQNLLKEINENADLDHNDMGGFLSELPTKLSYDIQNDLEMYKEFIIYGELVVPKPKKIVTEYDFK